jgi:hypothetical protein
MLVQRMCVAWLLLQTQSDAHNAMQCTSEYHFLLVENYRTTQKYARSAPFSPLSSFLRVFEKKKERRDHTALKERMGRHGLHTAHPKSWEKRLPTAWGMHGHKRRKKEE